MVEGCARRFNAAVARLVYEPTPRTVPGSGQRDPMGKRAGVAVEQQNFIRYQHQHPVARKGHGLWRGVCGQVYTVGQGDRRGRLRDPRHQKPHDQNHPTIMTLVKTTTNRLTKRTSGGMAVVSSSGGMDMAQAPFTELQVVIAADPPARLDKALARDVPEAAALSRSRLMRMIAEGCISREGVVVDDPRAKVAEGDVLVLRLEAAAEVETVAQQIALDVVYEDAALIVVNNPAGMVVHPARLARPHLGERAAAPLRRQPVRHWRREAARHCPPH